ncbi:MAG: helix-hairpin-helix domain-containing protein [Anaerolineales bacterium]
MNKTWWWVTAFIVVGVLLGAGIIFLVTRPPRGEPIVLLPAPTPAPIQVYVRGSVNQPGLYSLPPDSRVNDAIQAAGGFSEQADTGSLNLAEMLEDGEQLDVPALPSLTMVDREPGLITVLPTPVLTSFPTIVNINKATIEELDTLPEIGPKTAQAIIDYRNANGPFSSIEDILDVKGIGPVTFEKIKDLITVGSSP